MANGREIHGLASQAQEKGEFTEALKLTDEAMVAYQESGDHTGFAEVLAQRFLTLRHLYEKTGWIGYMILAKNHAMASVEIAEKSGEEEALAIPYFNLAKAQETLGEFSLGVETYKKALENQSAHPLENHARPGVIADFKNHMAVCEYKAGDAGAIERAEAAVEELKKTDEPQYNKDVWVSGGYMRMAEVLMSDNPTKAKEYLSKAREVIDSNPQLMLRLEQWEKLAARFA